MTIGDTIRDWKLQYDIKLEAAKISALLYGKIDKYEYLASEEMLPSKQKQIIAQANFTYSPLRNSVWKVFLLGVILVGFFPHSDWIGSIFLYSVLMQENTDQNNSEYGYFLRNEKLLENK